MPRLARPAAARRSVAGCGLGCIELVQQGQALHEQLRVIGERVAAQRGNVFCQPAGDHQRGRLAQFFFDALHHAVDEHRRAHHRAGKHAFFGIGPDSTFGRTQMHLRQLGAALPQRPQPGGKPRTDHAAPEHPVLIHHIKSSGGAQVHRDHRQREICRRVSGIHQPVLAHGMGLVHGHGQAGADLRRNDDRLFAGVITGALRQRPCDLGHHAGEHSALKPHGPLRVAAVRKYFVHFGTIFCSRAGMLNSDQKVILVTSTVSGEGKSFISANLAISLSLLGKKVVIVGLDIRKPGLNRVFRLSTKEKGITLYLANPETDLMSLVQPSDINQNLYILPGGTVPPNPTELLARDGLDKAIEILKKNFDYVILDTAPVGMVTDTLLIGRVADLSVYVCRADYTHKVEYTLINELAEEKKLPNICTVINGVDLKRRKYGYYYGYGKYGKHYGYGKRYGYGYGYGQEKKK